MSFEDFLETINDPQNESELIAALRELMQADPQSIRDISADWSPIGVWSGWAL